MWCPAITVVYSPDEDNDDAISDSDDNDDAAVFAAAAKMTAIIEIMIIIMTAVSNNGKLYNEYIQCFSSSSCVFTSSAPAQLFIRVNSIRQLDYVMSLIQCFKS